MKIVAITQARSGSTRLPNKVLKQIGNSRILEIHLERLLKSKLIDQLVLATTVEKADDLIEEIGSKNGLEVFRGSVNNVLDRYYQASKLYQADWVVRLTSDCPLIDPVLLDTIVSKALELDVDYCSNTIVPSFPDGMDVEVIKFSVLESSWKFAKLDSEKEHVTSFIYNNKDLFTTYNYKNAEDYSMVRLTVDEMSDFEVIKKLVLDLGKEKDWKTYADYYLSNSFISSLNNSINRNEGYIKSIKKDDSA